ncbi:site-specific integrase [Sinorhizobium meliloti]|nr:site-specific integrase [Sinorhizobium meliloti]MQU83323.1 tyrosine-type recombinase/integrase [Sinorhizobium meliloti]
MPEWRITRLRGEFCITWDDKDGVRRRYRLGTTDAQEAARRAPARYAELTRPVGTNVKALWDSYVLDKDGLAVLSTMKHTWKALAPRFANLEGSAVSVADCRAHTEERRKAGIKDGTIHTELGHLRMVLKWAENNSLISKAPHIERPAKPDPKEYHITRVEAARLRESANSPHIALAIRLLIATGARSTAALELTWDRVDFERGIINLRNPFDRTRRKGRAAVPMNDQLRADLLDAKKGAMSPFVIEWAGNRVKSIKKGLKAAGKASGLPEVSPHVLRHSAAVWMAEDGHSMSEIAQFLGHSNTKVTEKVYARFSPNYLRNLASSLTF